MALQLVNAGPGQWALQKENDRIGRAQLCGGRFLCFEVDARWRGRGYGTWFYKKVLAGAHLGPADSLWAPAPQTESGRAFLTKRGFVPDAQGLWVRRGAQRHTGQSALAVVHEFWRSHLPAGGFAVDATAGNGHDTALLCQLVGARGRVVALDIQAQAVQATNARLKALGLDHIGRAIQSSHADPAFWRRWCAGQPVDAVVFNLGYLPGAAHGVYTVPATTLSALNAACDALRPGGFVTVCAYWGPPQGPAERDAVLNWARALPGQAFWKKEFLFEDQPGCPPAALCLEKRG